MHGRDTILNTPANARTPGCLSLTCTHARLPVCTRTQITVLKAGDMVKLDLGVHVDGYISVIAHTVVVGTCRL